MVHRLFLSPGLFGFGRLASYDYFAHVRRALRVRFERAGQELISHVAEVLPTESVRRRAVTLAKTVHAESQNDRGPIHLLGHSTGGLDARLVASPSARLALPPETLSWLPRLRSVTTMNCPHYGTPLAKFFATVNGQRILYAVSALTYLGLTLGAPPLAYASTLVSFWGRGQRALGVRLGLVDGAVESLLRRLDEARSEEVREYLEGIKRDQGAVLQLTPEAMDLFQAGVDDRSRVVYQSTASMTPPPALGAWGRQLIHPGRALSMSLFTVLHGFTGQNDPRYPCQALRDADGRRAWSWDETERVLTRKFGATVTASSSDGVVPFRSQLWGKVVWAGLGDHLDVIGHYRDPSPDKGLAHTDWLTSGSSFDRAQFAQLMDAVATGMLDSSCRSTASSGALAMGDIAASPQVLVEAGAWRRPTRDGRNGGMG